MSLREGLVLCAGNPLLDISAAVPADLLTKYEFDITLFTAIAASSLISSSIYTLISVIISNAGSNT